MSDSEALKPCPFCGHKIIQLFAIEQYGGHWIVAQCQRCRAEVSEVTDYAETTITKWNRRSVPQDILPEEESLRDLVLRNNKWASK